MADPRIIRLIKKWLLGKGHSYSDNQKAEWNTKVKVIMRPVGQATQALCEGPLLAAMQKIIDQLTRELRATQAQVQVAVELLDGGSTVPFIARYRKEAYGGLQRVVVSEAGASVYSASEFASQEMPDVDLNTASAPLLARVSGL